MILRRPTLTRYVSTGAGLRRLADTSDVLVDPRVGIVASVEEVPRAAGAPDFFHFAAQACSTAAFSRQQNFAVTGGAATSRDLALAKAIGEAVERYCAALYNVNELLLTSYADAEVPCVQPRDFALFSARQLDDPAFPWAAFIEDTPVRWTPATEIATGAPCYVPAAMVYVPYTYYQGSDDTPITQPISTGLACHVGRTEATLSGLYEVVERDAFTLMWQARMSMPQIRVETLSDANYDRVHRFEAANGFVTLLDITLDAGMPTVLAVFRSDCPRCPALVFAAATSLDPEEAVAKSLEELAHTLRYSQQIMTALPRLVPEPEFDNVITQMHHLNYWCDHAHREQADFVFASPKRVDFDEMPIHSRGAADADLRRATRMISEGGYRVLACDLTTPDVEILGLSVVRVLVPGYNPLFMGHKIRALGGERLHRLPQALGYPGLAADESDNPYPHPYP